MKLNRSIEAWDKCDAGAMSQMSEAAIKYAFADAKQDIKRMAAIQAQLVAALKDITGDICERFDMESSSTNPGIKNCVENAHAALAAAGAQP